MLLEYLKEWFARTWLGERLQGFWRNIKFYAPLFHKEQRQAVWPQFKEVLKKEGKISILWRTVAWFIIAVICLACAPSCIAFFRLACIAVGIFGILINPFWTMWSFRKIFHDTDNDLSRAVAAKKRALERDRELREKAKKRAEEAEALNAKNQAVAEAKAKAAAETSKEHPVVTTVSKSRRKPLH